MAAIDWKKRYVANTASSYANFGARMLTGILVFTAILNHFSPEAFLFWQILWSFISYSIVLDFGMGFTIQRLVATKSAEEKMDEVDDLFTTAFWTFVVLGIVSFTVAFLLKGPFLSFFNVPEAMRPEFGVAYTYFAGSICILLPLGIFPAALIGIQRQYWFNWFSVASSIAYLLTVMQAIKLEWAFSQIILLSMAFTILPYALCTLLVFPMLKVITLNPLKYCLGAVKEQIRFSLIAYTNTCNYMFLGQSDRVVMGRMLPAIDTTHFQPGVKVAELLNGVAMQLMNIVPTAAAHLHATGEREPVRELFFNTNRLLFILTTPCYFLAAIYMEELLHFITDWKALPPHVWLTGEIILLVAYVSHLSSSAADRVLMMCGHEKVILRFTITRLLSHVILSIVLASTMGFVGVALAGLISVCTVNFGLLLPPVLRFLETNLGDYVKRHVRDTARAFLCFSVLLLAMKFLWPIPEEDSRWMTLMHLAIRGAIVMGPTLFLLRHEITGTWKGKAEKVEG